MRLLNLQALRGVACLLVLFYHIAEWELHKGYTPSVHVCGPFECFGFAGVDLFFVLSGFVITWVSVKRLGQPQEVAGFLVRRGWRIYPLYWICWALWAAAYVLILGEPWLPSTRWIVSNALIVPSHPLYLFIPQAWSLAYELLFYAVFAAFFVLPRRTFVLALLMWLTGLIGCALAGWPPYHDRGAIGRSLVMLVNPKVIEFVLGCLVAVILRAGRGERWGSAALALGVAVFAASGWLESAGLLQTKVSDLQRVLAFGLSSALIVFGATARERQTGWTLPRWLQATGDASYSIYLVHCAVLEVMHFWFRDMPHTLLPHLAYVALLAGPALGVGFATHVVVERRLMSMSFRRQPATVPAAIPLRRAA